MNDFSVLRRCPRSGPGGMQRGTSQGLGGRRLMGMVDMIAQGLGGRRRMGMVDMMICRGQE